MTFAHGKLLCQKEKLSEYILEDDETLQALVQAFCAFRKGEKIKNIVLYTKFELLTFKNFFQKLLNIFRNFKYTLNKNALKSQINLEIKRILIYF